MIMILVKKNEKKEFQKKWMIFQLTDDSNYQKAFNRTRKIVMIKNTQIIYTYIILKYLKYIYNTHI